MLTDKHVELLLELLDDEDIALLESIDDMTPEEAAEAQERLDIIPSIRYELIHLEMSQ